ncbi:MAG: 8-oxoguanine DNA glycosylase [Lachnospiraceae bacterium]|nr:8-oxoguanine DNA glycosylase [Lachnospiraceae bacterium]
MAVELICDNFDLEQTAESGQCFRWRKISEGEYLIPAFCRALKVKQDGNRFSFSCDDKEWKEIWKDYLDFDRDYGKIGECIKRSGDRHLAECFEKGCGIRVLSQDLWEMIVSFMISQNNNIPRIRGSIEKICALAGKRIEGTDVYAFPGPSDLSPGAFDDASLGLGYRAGYLKEMFEYTAENPEWLEGLKKLSYEEARKLLISKKGIGPKVADCVCLFGLSHRDAFPVDTHIKQLLSKYYPGGFDTKPYEGFGGIIQQYLFYYEIK